MQATKAQISMHISQSDQSFCLSLSGKYVSFTCNMQNYNCPASLCGLAGWIEPYLVTNPEDRFSGYKAHSIFEPVHEILVFMAYMHSRKSATILDSNHGWGVIK